MLDMQIQANEFRVGNLVLVGFKSGSGRKLESRIGVYDLERIIERPESSTFTYEPIPINEEWLLKFAFKKLNPDIEQYTNDFFVIDEAVFPSSKGEKRYDFRKKINEKESVSLRYITYIHQLQNIIYSLKSEELEVCK